MRYLIRVSLALALLFWAMTLHARSQPPANSQPPASMAAEGGARPVQTQQPR
jgi:hypothetical protein